MCDKIVRLQSQCFEASTDEERKNYYVKTFQLMLEHYSQHGELPNFIQIIVQNGPLDVRFQYKMQNDIS